MPDASNAKLEYEAAQVPVSITELTNQGDNIDFRSTDTIWSGIEGKAPVVTPNGIFDGGQITIAASASNDVVDITECRAYIAGVKTTISASTDEAIVRPSVSDYQIFSIQVTSGGAFSVVDGAEGSAFSETRAAAGGPPVVLVDSTELGQIRVSSQTPAAITANEIYQVPGTHQERYDNPLWEVNYTNVLNGSLGYAGIEFLAALPAIHTGSAVKDVYVSWYTPVFQEVVDAYDWVPPQNTISINSTEVYGRVKGAKSQSLGAGSFSAHLRDGVSDNILKQRDSLVWFRFYPNRLNAPYQLAQGYMAPTQEFPPGGNIAANFTVAAETQSDNVYA